MSQDRRARGACLTQEAQASTELKEREELQVVLVCPVSLVVLVLLVPLRSPAPLVLREIPVCLVWTESLVSRVLPVPLVPQAPAPLRATEASPVSPVSLALRVRKENPLILEAPVSLAGPGSKEREESPASAEDQV